MVCTSPCRAQIAKFSNVEMCRLTEKVIFEGRCGLWTLASGMGLFRAHGSTASVAACGEVAMDWAGLGWPGGDVGLGGTLAYCLGSGRAQLAGHVAQSGSRNLSPY